jgi:hypothetical protein
MMATDERFDELINWLEETAPSRVPQRVLNATFERTRGTRQQGGWRVALGRLSMPRFVPALGTAAVVVLAAVLAVNLFVNRGGIGGSPPPSDPRSFRGTWISTTDADGGTQTMTVRVTADGIADVVVHDDIATVCSFVSSTMTGAGRVDGDKLVIPAPEYTCDDGSEPQAVSGQPLSEQLRNMTFVRDDESGTLTDNFAAVWERPVAPPASSTPRPPVSDSMWPQATLKEVGQAQKLADAGDPDYTWQLDPALVGDAAPWGSEVLGRFMRQKLGWQEFRTGNGYAYGDSGGLYDELVLFRCAPGLTNPLYPDDPEAGNCAPTIDDFRYETVIVTLEQPARHAPSGIWVITHWNMLQPGEPRSLFDNLFPDFTGRQVQQAAPLADLEATAFLRAFLEARVDGDGAEQYLLTEPGESPSESRQAPLLYAATSDSPYERYEIDRLQGPVWPTGWIEYRVRLFAADGTVVEQSFVVVRQQNGVLGLIYGFPQTDEFPTTEDGQPVPVPFSVLEGEVTFAAALPWNGETDAESRSTTLLLRNRVHLERLEIAVDPLPVDGGCEPGEPPADAAALAQIIRSDPDVEVSVPVELTVAGVHALRMDVVAAPGASVCDQGFDEPLVFTQANTGDSHQGWLDQGDRMRLYLLDLPAGASARILAIAIVAPESEFERVEDTAAPVLDSIEFHVP